MIDIYLSVILKFFRATAPDLNYTARATLILSLVFCSLILTVLNVFDFDIRQSNKFLTVTISLVIFTLIYKYLSNEKKEQYLIEKFEKLTFIKKVIYSALSILFTILSFFISMQTYSTMLHG